MSASINSLVPRTIWSCRQKGGGASIGRERSSFLARASGASARAGTCPASPSPTSTFSRRRRRRHSSFEALDGKPQPLTPIDPAVTLPDRRLLRAGAAGIAAPAVTPGMVPVAGPRARLTGTREQAVAAEQDPAQFSITVVNGDLSFEPLPLLVGHYRSTQLTGAEAFIDRLTQRALSRSLDLGVYPMEPGTHQIFINTFLDPSHDALTPRPEAVIVAGLGQEGALRPGDLTRSVRRAVLGVGAARCRKRQPQERDAVDRIHAHGQRRTRGDCRAGSGADRTRGLRGQPAACKKEVRTSLRRRAPADRVVHGPGERSLARTPAADESDARTVRGAGTDRARNGSAAATAGVWIPRRRLRLHRGHDAPPTRRPADDRIRARHPPRAHRSPRAGDASAFDQESRGGSLIRPEPRSPDRQHVIQAARAR